MTDEMPAQGRREKRNFRTCFLDTAFAEQNLPGFINRMHLLGVVGLGNRDELDFIRRASGFPRRIGDLHEDAFEICGKIVHGLEKIKTRRAFGRNEKTAKVLKLRPKPHLLNDWNQDPPSIVACLFSISTPLLTAAPVSSNRSDETIP